MTKSKLTKADENALADFLSEWVADQISFDLDEEPALKKALYHLGVILEE